MAGLDALDLGAQAREAMVRSKLFQASQRRPSIAGFQQLGPRIFHGAGGFVMVERYAYRQSASDDKCDL
ncbi:hypothetical protein [Methylocystis suflitae]|uniref:hypothetical protein n=1 Tax=Methylocystis suflitae TaxID=2951405 RepID=UPI00210CFD29|nr:hypothetical protein [Methylocystis suflitae]MCQ4188668.1 hypothetical protein [Methylocystis suflitae]